MTYEMLTGDPPFTGSSVQAIVAKVLSAEPERPTLCARRFRPASKPRCSPRWRSCRPTDSRAPANSPLRSRIPRPRCRLRVAASVGARLLRLVHHRRGRRRCPRRRADAGRAAPPRRVACARRRRSTRRSRWAIARRCARLAICDSRSHRTAGASCMSASTVRAPHSGFVSSTSASHDAFRIRKTHSHLSFLPMANRSGFSRWPVRAAGGPQGHVARRRCNAHSGAGLRGAVRRRGLGR